MKRKFSVTLSKTVEIVVDDQVLRQGLRDDNPVLGKGASERDVVEHLAFNLVGNGLRLSQIDGYANMPDDAVKIPAVEWDVEIEPSR